VFPNHGKRSNAWKHFRVYPEALQRLIGGRSVAVCNLCHDLLVNGKPGDVNPDKM
jgi:hypothetical protein